MKRFLAVLVSSALLVAALTTGSVAPTWAAGPPSPGDQAGRADPQGASPTYVPSAASAVTPLPPDGSGPALTPAPTSTPTAGPSATPTGGPAAPGAPPASDAGRPQESPPAANPEQALLLNVPYRSQFDGSPYANANCGPASLAMVLEAYGIEAPTAHLRELANRLQGTSGYSDGVALDTLQAIAGDAGLEVVGLHAPDGGYARWTADEVRRQVSRGWPVITLVHYRSLPGNEALASPSDHYVVVVGLSPSGFFVHDPAFDGQAGRLRALSHEQLRRAWADSGVPGQAIALGPGKDRLPLAVAPLLASELSGLQPPVQALGPPPLPPPSLPPPPAPTKTAATRPAPAPKPAPTITPTRTPAPDRWSRRSEQPAPTKAGAAPPASVAGPAADPATAPDDALVLAMGAAQQTDHLAALGVVAVGALAAAVVLRRRPRDRRASRYASGGYVVRPSVTGAISWRAGSLGDARAAAGPTPGHDTSSSAACLPPLPPGEGEGEAPPAIAPTLWRAQPSVGSPAPSLADERPDDASAPEPSQASPEWGPTEPCPRSLLAALEAVPDPRGRRGQRYGLASILVLAALAMLCGALVRRSGARQESPKARRLPPRRSGESSERPTPPPSGWP